MKNFFKLFQNQDIQSHIWRIGWIGIKLCVATPLFFLLGFLAYDVYRYADSPRSYSIKLWVLLSIILFGLLESIVFCDYKKWKGAFIAVFLVIYLSMLYFNADVYRAFNDYLSATKDLLDFKAVM